MNLTQTIAFLQWLKEGQRMAAFQQERSDLNSWIEANGFDPAVINQGLIDLQQKAELSDSLTDLLGREGGEHDTQAWIAAAEASIKSASELRELAGGTSNVTPVNTSAKTKTRSSVLKELQERIDVDIEKQLKKENFVNLATEDITKEITGTSYTKNEVFEGTTKKQLGLDWENWKSAGSKDVDQQGKDKGLIYQKDYYNPYYGLNIYQGTTIEFGWGGNSWDNGSALYNGDTFQYTHVLTISIDPDAAPVVPDGEQNMGGPIAGENWNETSGLSITVSVTNNIDTTLGPEDTQGPSESFYIGNFTRHPEKVWGPNWRKTSDDHWYDWYFYDTTSNGRLQTVETAKDYVDDSLAYKAKENIDGLTDHLAAIAEKPFVYGLLKYELSPKQFKIASRVYTNLLWFTQIPRKDITLKDKEYIGFDIFALNREAKKGILNSYPIFNKIKILDQKLDALTAAKIYQRGVDDFVIKSFYKAYPDNTISEPQIHVYNRGEGAYVQVSAESANGDTRYLSAQKYGGWVAVDFEKTSPRGWLLYNWQKSVSFQTLLNPENKWINYYKTAEKDYQNICQSLKSPYVKKIIGHDLKKEKITISWLELLRINACIQSINNNLKSYTRKEKLFIASDLSILYLAWQYDSNLKHKLNSFNVSIKNHTKTSKQPDGIGIDSLIKHSATISANAIYKNAEKQIVAGEYRLKPSPLPKYEQIINHLIIRSLASNGVKVNVNYNFGDYFVPYDGNPYKEYDVGDYASITISTPIYSFTLKAGYEGQSEADETLPSGQETSAGYGDFDIDTNYSVGSKKGTVNFSVRLHPGSQLYGLKHIYFISASGNDFCPKLAALNLERKWWKSQAKEINQIYSQSKETYLWIQEVCSYPLTKLILKHNARIDAYSTDVKRLSSKHPLLTRENLISLNTLCLGLAELYKGQLTRKQKHILNHKIDQWKRHNGGLPEIYGFIDLIFLGSETARFIKLHQQLLHLLLQESEFIEGITPDKIYQTTIDNYLRDKYKPGVYYKVPAELLPESDSSDNLSIKYDTLNYSEPKSVYFELETPKQTGTLQIFDSNGSIQYSWHGVNDINGTLKSNRFYQSWKTKQISELSNAERQIQNFYKHTRWLLGFAFMPRLVLESLLKSQFAVKHNITAKYNKASKIELAGIRKLALGFNNVMLGISNVKFKKLSAKKQSYLIADYILVDSYYQCIIRPELITRENSITALKKIYKLAKASMAITPAQIYQSLIFGKKPQEDLAKNAAKVNVDFYGHNSDHAISAYGTLNGKNNSQYYISGYGGSYTIELQYSTKMYYSNGGYHDTVNSKYSLNISSGTAELVNDSTDNIVNSVDFTTPKQMQSIIAFATDIHFLSGYYLNNKLVAINLSNYIHRHKILRKLFAWLPPGKALNQLYEGIAKTKLRSLDWNEKIILAEDDILLTAVLDNYLSKQTVLKRHQELRLVQELNRDVVDLTRILKKEKFLPGKHGRIDDMYKAAAPGGCIDKGWYEMFKSEYSIENNPSAYIKSEGRTRASRKKWKDNNEKWSQVQAFNNQFNTIANAENTFYQLENKAITNAEKAYISALQEGFSKKESKRLADEAYLSTLFKEDKAYYDIWNERWRYFYDPDHNEIYDELLYRELKETKKLLHIQNSKHFKRLRLDILLTRYKLDDLIAKDYTNHYQKFNKYIQSKYEKSGFDMFWIDLGKACWDIIKSPIAFEIVFWKDLVTGDNFFVSLNQGLIKEYKDCIKATDYIWDDFHYLFDFVNNVFLDVEFLGGVIFFWAKDIPGMKKTWKIVNHVAVYAEDGVLIITKAIFEIPLHLARDVDKIAKGLFFWLTDQESFGQMLWHLAEPLYKTVDRLAKFSDHIVTGKDYIIKDKVGHIKHLFHYMKTRQQVKRGLQLDKMDRHIRKQLHKETFGIIRSPFQKFKQRHTSTYNTLVLFNQRLNESGYFDSHIDASIAEKQLDAIDRAYKTIRQDSLIKSAYTYELDEEKEEFKSLSKREQLKVLNKYHSMTLQQVTAIIKKDLVNQFDSYFHINNLKQSMKSIKKRDEKGLLKFEEYEGKVHLASCAVVVIEGWSTQVIKRNKRDLGLMLSLPNHGQYLLLGIGLYDVASNVVNAIKNEQKRINQDWSLWGKKDGLGINKALTTYLLPGFVVTKSSNEYFGWMFPDQIDGVALNKSGKASMISSKQVKAMDNYENKHHIGEKIFDIVMWTFFLNRIAVDGGKMGRYKFSYTNHTLTVTWVTTKEKTTDGAKTTVDHDHTVSFKLIFPAPLKKDAIVNSNVRMHKTFSHSPHPLNKRLSNNMHDKYLTAKMFEREKRVIHFYHDYWSKYRGVYRFTFDNYKYLVDLIDAKMPSLSTINKYLKAFMDGAAINNKVLYHFFGKYENFERSILAYDYDKQYAIKTSSGDVNSYGYWKYEMEKNHAKEWNYLKEDRIVLQHDAKSETITVGDVLETFTPQGISSTQQEYSTITGSTIEPESAKKTKPSKPTNSSTGLTPKEIARETKVSPLVIFGQYKFLKHLATKGQVKKDIAKDSKQSLDKKEQQAIENDTCVIDSDVKKDGHKIIDNYFDEMEAEIEVETEEMISGVTEDIVTQEETFEAVIEVL